MLLPMPEPVETAHDITESARLFVAALPVWPFPKVSEPEPAKPLDPRAAEGIARAQQQRTMRKDNRSFKAGVVQRLSELHKLRFIDIPPRKRGDRGVTVAYTPGRIATVSTAVFNPHDRGFDHLEGRYIASTRLDQGHSVTLSLPSRAADAAEALRSMFFPY